jgi:hypothetical protein
MWLSRNDAVRELLWQASQMWFVATAVPAAADVVVPLTPACLVFL